MRFNSILIGSENPQRLVEFYKRIFGEPGWADETYTGWMLGNGFVMIGPHDQVHGQNAEPGRLVWNVEADDVRSEFERMKAAGATVVREPYNPMGPTAPQETLIATFADPDGNYFQIASPMQM